MRNSLPVWICDDEGKVVEVAWVPDPRIEYCRQRNELLSGNLRAVVPHKEEVHASK